LQVLEDAVRLAVTAGLPPAALVRRAAAEERRRAAAVRQRAIRRLEVLLVLPVGLCLLPAFVLLGIVPVVVDLLLG
jgi:tight adherence protein B